MEHVAQYQQSVHIKNIYQEYVKFFTFRKTPEQAVLPPHNSHKHPRTVQVGENI